jgi:hypothetical protein
LSSAAAEWRLTIPVVSHSDLQSKKKEKHVPSMGSCLSCQKSTRHASLSWQEYSNVCKESDGHENWGVAAHDPSANSRLEMSSSRGGRVFHESVRTLRSFTDLSFQICTFAGTGSRVNVDLFPGAPSRGRGTLRISSAVGILITIWQLFMPKSCTRNCATV